MHSTLVGIVHPHSVAAQGLCKDCGDKQALGKRKEAGAKKKGTELLILRGSFNLIHSDPTLNAGLLLIASLPSDHPASTCTAPVTGSSLLLQQRISL